MRKLLIIITMAATVLVGCSTIRDIGQTAATAATAVLNKANTVSTALALRDGYSDMKASVIENADLFSTDELAELEYHAAIIESFYSTVTGLASSGNTNDMLVHADEFLDAVLIVRSTIDNAIAIIEPKASLMGSDDLISTAITIRNYRNVSGKLDAVLAKDSRKESILVATSLLKAAIPVLQTLKVFL